MIFLFEKHTNVCEVKNKKLRNVFEEIFKFFFKKKNSLTQSSWLPRVTQFSWENSWTTIEPYECIMHSRIDLKKVTYNDTLIENKVWTLDRLPNGTCGGQANSIWIQGEQFSLVSKGQKEHEFLFSSTVPSPWHDDADQNSALMEWLTYNWS